MSKLTNLTVKGQVTIPKDVRDALGLKAGEPVAFEREGDRVFLRKGDIDEAERERRYAAALADIDRVVEKYKYLRTGRPTDEIMGELRGDDPLP
jgi:AbrB family looped-hinge helix DNA binding protein